MIQVQILSLVYRWETRNSNAISTSARSLSRPLLYSLVASVIELQQHTFPLFCYLFIWSCRVVLGIFVQLTLLVCEFLKHRDHVLIILVTIILVATTSCWHKCWRAVSYIGSNWPFGPGNPRIAPRVAFNFPGSVLLNITENSQRPELEPHTSCSFHGWVQSLGTRVALRWIL